MNTIMKLSFYFILFIFASASIAQLDPSTSVLVRRGAAAVEAQPEELDSTRYEVRPNQSPTSASKKSSKASKLNISADGAAVKTSSTSATAGDVQVKASEVKSTEVKVVTPAPASKEEAAEQEKEQQEQNYKTVELKTEKVNLPLSQQLQIMLLGDPQEIESFRQQLHPLDTKNNVIEIALSPYLFYTDSQSPYWYRRYNFGSLGLAGDARIWITPFFGVHGAYRSSLAADMAGNPTGTFRSPVNFQTTEGGLRFRKYFGLYRKAPQVSFSLDYQDQRLNPSGDSNQRLNLKTAGLRIGVDAQVPSTLAYSNTYSFAFVPRPSMTETSSLGVTSGGSPETYALETGVGGLYQLDRYHQMFWRLDYRYQKASYKDSASAADPVSGLTPSRVPVTESTAMFHFGFQFGQ